MSVGHTARVLEEAGISSVVVYIRSFMHQAHVLSLPRALITPHILGRTIGAPHDDRGQREVVRAALRLLEDVKSPGAVVEFQTPYRPVAAPA